MFNKLPFTLTWLKGGRSQNGSETFPQRCFVEKEPKESKLQCAQRAGNRSRDPIVLMSRARFRLRLL